MPTHVAKLLRLTLFAPDVVKPILDGRPTAELDQVLKLFTVQSGRQRGHRKRRRVNGSSASSPQRMLPQAWRGD